MSSPRNPPKPVHLDQYTFGKAPACMYLTVLLNEKNDRMLVRRATKLIGDVRATIMDVVASHMNTDEMSAATFGLLLTLLDQNIRERTANLKDEFIGHIVANILIGELRTYKRRTMQTSVLQVKVARATPEGKTVPQLKVMPRIGEPTEEERILELQEKSRKYLERKGKRNTLY